MSPQALPALLVAVLLRGARALVEALQQAAPLAVARRAALVARASAQVALVWLALVARTLRQEPPAWVALQAVAPVLA